MMRIIMMKKKIMVKKTKMDSAKDQANHMSKVIKNRQRDAAKSGLGGGAMAGMGGGGGFEDDPYGAGGDFGALGPGREAAADRARPRVEALERAHGVAAAHSLQ